MITLSPSDLAALERYDCDEDHGGVYVIGLCVMRDGARAAKAEAHYTHAIEVAFDTASRKLRVFIIDPALIFKIAP